MHTIDTRESSSSHVCLKTRVELEDYKKKVDPKEAERSDGIQLEVYGKPIQLQFVARDAS